MPIVKRAVASLAACGVLMLQSAVAAASPSATRTAAVVGAGQDLAGAPEGSIPVIALIAVLALIAGVAVVLDDDDDEVPTSP